MDYLKQSLQMKMRNGLLTITHAGPLCMKFNIEHKTVDVHWAAIAMYEIQYPFQVKVVVFVWRFLKLLGSSRCSVGNAVVPCVRILRYRK